MKFTLRDLFWLVIVVALSTAWWLEHRAAAAAKEHNHFLGMEYRLLQSRLREARDYVNELEPPPNRLQGE